MKTSNLTNAKKNKLVIDKPLITTDFQKFWIAAFNFSFSYMIKKSFYSFRVKGLENYELRDKTKGNIIYSSHNCWWDGIIGYILCRKIFKTEMHMMIEGLQRLPLLSKIGAFSVEKGSAQSSIKALNYSAEFLKNPDNSLWIFPEGVVKPPDFRPIKFANGISYICKKSEGLNLIPVAKSYNFIREDRPEILLEIGKPIIIDQNCSKRKELTSQLEQNFTELLDNQKKDISSGNLDDYKVVIKSRLCLLKLFEKYFNYITRNFNT